MIFCGVSFATSIYLSKTKNKSMTLYVLLGFLVLFILYYYAYEYFANLNLVNSEMYIFLSQAFLLIAIVLGLSIFFNLFSEKIRRIPGVWGFVVNFIFYIPCIIGDFFIFVKDQLKLTPSVTYLLLLVETIVLTGYFVLPLIYKKYISKPQEVIMENPRFIDRKQLIATGKDLPKTTPKNKNGGEFGFEKEIDQESIQNYTISLWIYLNVQDNTTKVKHVFNYGGEPLIEYIDNQPNIENKPTTKVVTGYEKIKKCKFTLFQDSSNNSETLIHLEEQKWHNVVFNYNNNKCDLFINGKLEYSAMSNIIKNKSDNDKIEIGDDNLKGSICNVIYYPQVLSDSEIAIKYNLLLNNNPPLNNII
tara:strand:+ start:111 stop:1193 length:1083 start_codon:yes stop_codon:yes gene_type:complete